MRTAAHRNHGEQERHRPERQHVVNRRHAHTADAAQQPPGDRRRQESRQQTLAGADIFSDVFQQASHEHRQRGDKQRGPQPRQRHVGRAQHQQAQQGASKHGQAADTGRRARMVCLRLVQIAVAGKPAMPAFRPHDEPAHHERDHAYIQPGHRITSGWSIETGPPLWEAGVTPIYGRDKEVQFRGTKRNTRDRAVRPPPGRWMEGADATKPRTRGDTDFMR
ncbi:hypothetical protein G6F65_018682 [Rhizopus arrhizus]|nr:hypothetical protein G6F65_018682 [Rhizopus arrhizus]